MIAENKIRKALCRLLPTIYKVPYLRISLFDLWLNYYSTFRRKTQYLFAKKATFVATRRQKYFEIFYEVIYNDK